MHRGFVSRFTILLAALIIFVSSCAVMDKYGKLSPQQESPRLTPEDLAQNWKKCNVYYTGYSPENPFAIIFEPKADNRTLHVHRWWTPVKDEKTMREVMKWLGLRKERDPVVYRIVAPNGDLYGFMYTAHAHVTIKVISDNSLWVDQITKPKDYAPGTYDSSFSR